MADLSGFLNALGMMFNGMAQDQKNAFARQMEQQHISNETGFRSAYANELNARAGRDQAQADRIGKQETLFRTPEFQADYTSAMNGDQGAISRVASAVAGHPNAAALLAPLVRPDKPEKQQWDSERGAWVSPDGSVTVPTGLPPRPRTATEVAAILREQNAARVNAKTALDEARRDVPRPSTIPSMSLGTDAQGKPAMIPNPARAQAVTDSTNYERTILDPARQALVQATGGGGFPTPPVGPAAPVAKPNPPAAGARSSGALPPLSATDRVRRTTDPAFDAWLRAKGY